MGRYRCLLYVTAPDGHQIRVQFNEVHLSPMVDILSLNKNIYSGYDDTPEEDLITKGRNLEIGYYTPGIGTYARGFSLVVSDYLPPGEKTNRRASKKKNNNNNNNNNNNKTLFNLKLHLHNTQTNW